MERLTARKRGMFTILAILSILISRAVWNGTAAGKKGHRSGRLWHYLPFRPWYPSPMSRR